MIENLESRRLFSISIVSGVLTVNGSTSGETISAAWKTLSNGNFTVRVSDGATSQDYTYNTSNPPGNSFQSVSLYGGNGSDNVYCAVSVGLGSWQNTESALLPITANGAAGTDTVWGSQANDTLLGGSSNDHLDAFDGNDSLNGNDGSDTLLGNYGQDTLNVAGDSYASDWAYGDQNSASDPSDHWILNGTSSNGTITLNDQVYRHNSGGSPFGPSPNDTYVLIA